MAEMTVDMTTSSRSLDTESEEVEAVVPQKEEHDDSRKQSASWPCMSERRSTNRRQAEEPKSPHEELNELLPQSLDKCRMPHSAPTLLDYPRFITVVLRNVLSKTSIGRFSQKEATPSDVQPSVGNDDRFQSPSDSLIIDSADDSPLAHSLSLAEFGAQFVEWQYIGSISQESLINGHSFRTPSPVSPLAMSMMSGRHAVPTSCHIRDACDEDEDSPCRWAVSWPPSQRDRERCNFFISRAGHSQQSV